MRSLGKKARGARLERMRASPRWVDGGFRNVSPVLPGLRDPNASLPSVGEFLCGGERRVPRGPLPSVSPLPVWSERPSSGLRVTWLGHSTVLVEIGGRRVLTDPVWGRLPPVDAVLVSHDHYDHYDHLDYPTIRRLARRDVPFVTSLGVGAHLEAWGVRPERIVELDWWESHDVAGLRLTAAPAQHFSGRSLTDRNATLWSSFAIRDEGHSVFFSGDTGLTNEYGAIAARLGPFDLVMLEVGAFHPAWGDMHLGPENALEAVRLLGGAPLLPVHWGTFKLAMHPWDEPAEELLALASGTGTRLVMPRLGEPVEPGREERVEPWWRSVESRKPSRPAREPRTRRCPTPCRGRWTSVLRPRRRGTSAESKRPRSRSGRNGGFW